jgi:hypothetical protein
MSMVMIDVPTPVVRLAATRWQEYFAPGETLGHLLTRVVSERPGFAAIYDPATRRLGNVSLLVNGRAYNLVGGLTYLLHETDTLTIGPPSDAGQSRD